MQSPPVILHVIFVTVALFIAFIYSGKSGLVIRKLQEWSYGKPGCVPVADVGNVTLYYFDVRGRGEAIRLLLEETQITYEQVLFNKLDWPKIKEEKIKSGLLTFGQVPAIETTSGVNMVQSQAIMHYLARSTGLECNCEDLLLCETIAGGVEDTRKKLGSMLYNSHFSLRDRDHYFDEHVPLWFGYLEKLAPPLAKQERAFFASDRLTWVDFLVFDLLENHVELAKFDFTIPASTPNVLANFPKLHNFYQHFASRPHISAYRNNYRRHPFTIPFMPVEVDKKNESS